MICAIGLEQQEALATAIHKSLKDKVKFDLNELTNEIYNFVLDASKNKEQAIAYARLVPKWTGILLQADTSLRKKLGASIDAINNKADFYETAIDNVLTDLPGLKDPITELVDGQKFINDLVNQEKLEAEASRLQKTIDARQAALNERSPGFFGTFSFEGSTEPFPFVIQRKLLREIAKTSSSDNGGASINYPGVGPIYLRPVQTESLGEDNWTKDANGNLSYKPQANDIAYALADKDGNLIHFDENGNVTTKEKGGRVAYYTVYRSSNFITVDENGKPSFHPYILKKERVTEGWQQRAYDNFQNAIRSYALLKKGQEFDKLTKDQQKQVGREMLKQLEINYYLEKLALEKPEKAVLLNITGGSMVIDSQPVQIQVQLEKMKLAGQSLIKPYFMKDNTRFDITIRPGLEQRDVESVMNLLFNEDLMIKDASGNMRNISYTDRLRMLHSLMFIGERSSFKTTNGDQVLVNTKELQIAIDKDGKYKIAVLPKQEKNPDKFQLKVPVKDISTDPNAKEVVREYLQKTAFYHVSENYTNDPNNYSRPDVSTEEGKSVITPVKQNYNDWIKTNPKFEYLTKNVTEEVVPDRNPFFIYEPTEDTIRTIVEQKPQNALTPIEKVIANQPAPNSDEAAGLTPKDTPAKDDPGTVEGFKEFINKTSWEKLQGQKTGNINATPEQIEEARKWYESSPLKNQFPFEAVFNAVNQSNPSAVAQWTIDGITLYKGADYSDLYHEAWHGFSQTFLTPEKRKEMYNELRKKKSGSFTDYDGKNVTFASANDLQLEEYLAEKFREYVLSKGTKTDTDTPKTNSIFRKIFNFLKELFGLADYSRGVMTAGETPLINELFEKLRVGNISQFNFDANNRGFGVLYSTINAINPEAETRTKLTYQDSMLIIDSIDSIFSEVMDDVNSQNQNKKFTVTLYTSNANKLNAYKAVKIRFEELLKEQKEKLILAIDPAQINKINYNIDLLIWAINNFGDLTSIEKNIELGKGIIFSHIQKSKLLSNEDKAAAYEKDDFNEKDPEAKGRTAFERSGQDNSLKDLASKEILYLIRGLHKHDAKGNLILNSLGVPMLAEFDKSWNYLARTLEGNLNPQSMNNKLRELQENTEDLASAGLVQQLANKLGSIDSKSYFENHLWTNFWQTFNKTRVPLIQMTLKVTYERDPNGKILYDKTNYNITIGEAQSSSNAVVAQWENQFANINTEFIKEKKIDVKKDKYAQTENYLDLAAILRKYPNPKEILSSPNKAFDFLTDVGITLKYRKEIIKELQDNPDIRKAVGIVYNTIYHLQNESKDPSAKTAITSIKALFADYDGLGSNENRLKDLKELEAKYGDSQSSGMVSNAEGNTQFEQSLNSSMTVLIDAINSVKSFGELISLPYMAHWNPETNPFVKDSIWLKSIFNVDDQGNFGDKRNGKDGKPIRLNFENLSGTKVVDEDGSEDGISTASSDPATKIILDFHSNMFLGRPELPRHADKSSSYTAYVSEILVPGQKNRINKYKYIDDVDFFLNEGRNSFSKDGFLGTSANRQMLMLVMPYVKNELKRIEMLKAMEADYLRRKELDPQAVLNYDHAYLKNGQKFVIFDDVFSVKLKKDLIEAGSDNLSDYSEAIQKSLTKYFNNVIADTSKEMTDDSMYIDGSVTRKINSDILTKTENRSLLLKNKKDVKAGSIASFVVNSWIHNLETIVLMYGDPALYNHEKEEFHKRNAGIASTGELFRTDTAGLLYANSLGRRYAAKEGLFQKELAMDGSFDAAVMEDSIPKSKYLKEYSKAINEYFKNQYPDDPAKAKQKADKAIKAYTDGEIKEGDAQGWITFDAYRILLTLQGKWSQDQENLYNKIVNDEPIKNEDILQFFPVKKVQYWGPLKGVEGPPIMAMHKFSLLPLIPNVIKGTNLEKLHNRMVNEGIDYATFKTGSKIGTITSNGKADAFYSDQDTRTFDSNGKFTKNTIFLNFMKDQLETGDSFKGKVTFPSQMRKLLIDGFVEQGIPRDFETKLSMKERKKKWAALKTEQEKQNASPYYKMYKTYENRVEDLTKEKYDALLKRINYRVENGKLVGDVKNLVRYIQKQFDAQDLSDHEKAFIQEYEGRLKNDLSLSLSADKIEKILNAIVVRELVKQKVNGEGLVQVSAAGWERVGSDSALSTYHIDEKTGTVQPMEVMISMQGEFLKMLDMPAVKQRAESKGISALDALNELISDKDWLEKGDNSKMITLTAARIPVQGRNSMEFMRVKKFLSSSSGNTIVVPSEIVAKAGSDFDIDKLFTMMPKLFVDKESGKVKYDKTSKENLVMESQVEILSNKDEFVNLIRPNGVDIFEDMANDLKSDVSEYNPMDSFNEDPERLTSKGKPMISPTRIFEPRYNLYKQNTNNVGKQVLGIGAVDNTYNVLFNRIGMYMNPTVGNVSIDDYYAERERIESSPRKQKVPKWVKEFSVQRLLLPHNTMTLDNGQEVISLSNSTDAENDNRISDVINQMINGWVDVAKDTWIFNIQGNKEITPTLLFLVQAGVPIETAVFFVSQPLIRKYVEIQRQNKGMFAGPLGHKPSKPNLAAYEARKKILMNIIGVDSFATKSKKGKNVWYNKMDLFDKTMSFTEPYKKNFFDKTELRTRIKTYNDALKAGENITEDQMKDLEFSDMDKAVFLHFLEVENMAKAITEFKSTTNVDTSRQTTLFEAKKKQTSIAKVKRTGRVPFEMVNKLQQETAIGSFFDVLKWQQTIWGDYFKLRDNQFLTKKLTNILESADASDIIDMTFAGNDEKFATEFMNDFPVFLLQQKMYSFDLNKLEAYRGYRSSEPTKVVPVNFLDFAVYFKAGVLYVDKNQLATDWENLESLSKEYNVAPVSKSLFHSKEEYFRFVFEREYLRSQFPIEKLSNTFMYKNRFDTNKSLYTSRPENTIAKITYEETLKDMALTNTYNLNHMFKGKDSMATKLMQIKKTFKDLADNYAVMEVLGIKKTNQNVNIRLTDKLLDSDKVEKYHENIMELSDPDRIKVEASYEDKKLIADFFKKLSVYGILQSGMNTNTDLSIQRILDDNVFLSVMKPIAEDIAKNGIAPSKLDEYTDKFIVNVNKIGSANRGKFKDYMKPLPKVINYDVESADESAEEAIVKPSPMYKDAAGRTLINLQNFSDEAIEDMVKNNPDVVFVYNDAIETPKFAPKGNNAKYGYALKKLAGTYPNVVGIKTRMRFTDDFNSAVIQDAVIDGVKQIDPKIREQIDMSIQTINEFMEDGKTVAFISNGYGQKLINADDLTGKVIITKSAGTETFKYLSEALNELGFINPNYTDKIPDAKMKLLEAQPITDEQVYDKLKFCFGL